MKGGNGRRRELAFHLTWCVCPARVGGSGSLVAGVTQERMSMGGRCARPDHWALLRQEALSADKRGSYSVKKKRFVQNMRAAGPKQAQWHWHSGTSRAQQQSWLPDSFSRGVGKAVPEEGCVLWIPRYGSQVTSPKVSEGCSELWTENLFGPDMCLEVFKGQQGWEHSPAVCTSALGRCWICSGKSLFANVSA